MASVKKKQDKKRKNWISQSKIGEGQYRIGEIEYTKNVLKALKEAIDENDKLREIVAKLNSENEKMKSELDEKDNAILDLENYYNVSILLFYYLISFVKLTMLNINQLRKKLKKEQKQMTNLSKLYNLFNNKY